MQQRVSLITLGVDDLRRARAFYEALGWRSRAEPEADVVFFQTGGSVLALWDRQALAQDSGIGPGDGPPGFAGVTLAHNVFSPGEVDAILATPPRRARPSRGRPARPSGAATQACSWTSTCIPGRSRTTRAGASTRLGT